MLPAALAEKSGLELYKFDGSCLSVLVCEGEFHYLGMYFGGYGITSAALSFADGEIKLTQALTD